MRRRTRRMKWRNLRLTLTPAAVKTKSGINNKNMMLVDMGALMKHCEALMVTTEVSNAPGALRRQQDPAQQLNPTWFGKTMKDNPNQIEQNPKPHNGHLSIIGRGIAD
mmetsp:Transcript_121911/g.316561  ORF Transcript_121911/g.316561 Transcript_121911/m.316561 type:complete len:108 (-) Transcript_121911:943-1266(-)